MPVELALYQPDIAQNTGTMLRMGACLDVVVHIIHPTGFAFSRAALRRAGMDYLDHVQVMEHTGWPAFDDWRGRQGKRLVLLTTKASTPAHEASFTASDILMVGRESAGVPDAVAERADLRIRIPMRADVRSLNVAVSAAIVLGEALRQTGGYAALD
jgi:tRNA (cytidine/uridine-2'-O-)-methyltransferase